MASIFDQLTAKKADAGEDSSGAEACRAETRGPLSDDAASANDFTPRRVKEATLELLKYGSLEQRRKPNLYRDVLMQRDAIGRVLEPLDLALRVDEIRGLAYLVVAATMSDTIDDEWSHPLVRRQRLNLEQSLLIAILRQQFVAHEQHAGVGTTDASVVIEELLPQLRIYLGDMGSDAQEQKRLRTLLESLKGHGVVSEVDEHDRIEVRPIIAHLANPENLQNLLQAFRDESQRRSSEEESPSGGEP